MTGTLGLFSLVDLFQLLASSARTGRLAVDHPEGTAKVYFDRGQAVHAEFGELIGDDAVYALFDDERGAFEFTIGLPAPQRSIELSTENLVLEAIRRFDEARRDDVQERVPRQAVPMIGERDATELTLRPTEIEILQRIDGTRNVTQIALEAGVEPEVAMSVVARLVKIGVARLKTQAPRTARLVTRLAQTRLPRGHVGIDASIVTTWQRSIGTRPERVACKRKDGRVVSLAIEPIEDAGPYLHISREMLFQTGLTADETLLVKPVTKESAT